MIEPWPPSRYSPPLTEGFPSVFGRYRTALRIAWLQARGYRLEDWQEALLEAITEIDPATGHLRRRQVLVSVARQNGKSELAAALALLVLLWKRTSLVVGIASTAEQARLVYRRSMQVIAANPALASRFEALTDTRGIRGKDGSLYEIKAAKSAALQGLPVDLAVVDEVHLVREELWTDLLAGTGGRPDCLVVGITTAGDEGSTLLKRLYALADSGDGGDAFAHFIWESPTDVVSEDDDELAASLAAASPAIASGRVDVATVLADVRTTPVQDVVRYRLNRFVASSGSFLPAGAWAACRWGSGEDFPHAGRLVFTVDRTPEWTAATITASTKDAEGLLWTTVVASQVSPSLESLTSACLALPADAVFVVDRYALKELGDVLRRRGREVVVLTTADVVNAAAMGYAKVMRREIRHGGDEVLSVQLPHAVRKNLGSGFRISRQDSTADIDSVCATMHGLYAAETLPEVEVQLF